MPDIWSRGGGAAQSLLESRTEAWVFKIGGVEHPGTVMERMHCLHIAMLGESAHGLRRDAEVICGLRQVHPPFSPLPFCRSVEYTAIPRLFRSEVIDMQPHRFPRAVNMPLRFR